MDNHKLCRFLMLAAELRLHIYEHVITSLP
jgi:hypothetical protein